jgi:ribonuclease G
VSEELLINVTPHETRVAMVENGVLQEVRIERSTGRGLVGNIYKGKVVRVLPGMQSAFVEVGLARTAFLHASDVAVGEGESRRNGNEQDIRALLREGQEILVQVVKDPIGGKGARLTTHLTIPSRYLVFLPGGHHVGISQKIEDAEERERLRALVATASEGEERGGYIVRTVAEGAGEEEVAADVTYLQRLWDSIHDRAAATSAPGLVHEDLPLALQVLRDMAGTPYERVRVDSRETYQRIREFAETFVPEMVELIEHYPGERPLFDLYSVEEEIQKALERKVELKSGGYLIIDQTEAMTTVDVNTGAYVGHRNLEETIFKTNLEAAQAIARQLRLRNLGGIIILDFIDMGDQEHRRQVLRALESALERDRARARICEVSALGLVEMTRKRTRESLEQILCEPCPTCGGRGTVKTTATVCYEIFREVLRSARQFDTKELLVLAAQEVVDRMLDEESASVAELEDFIGRSVRFQVEALYTQEQFDVVLL